MYAISGLANVRRCSAGDMDKVQHLGCRAIFEATIRLWEEIISHLFLAIYINRFQSLKSPGALFL